MHELVIVEGILDVVLPEVKKTDAKKILAIRLRVGELSGIVPSCLHEYFSIASQGTMAEGAELILLPVPIRIHCPDCGAESVITRGMDVCPRCGGRRFRIISGREYFVESVEAE